MSAAIKSIVKTIIVETINRLPIWCWSPASRIVTRIWPGFRRA